MGTSIEQRTAPVVPEPRTGGRDARPGTGGSPRPEPRRTTPRVRPPQDYWDVFTARWRTRDGSTPDPG